MSETILRELIVKFKGDTGPLGEAIRGAHGQIAGFASEAAAAAGPAGIAFGAVAAVIGIVGGAAIQASKEIGAAYREIIFRTGETGTALEGLKQDFAAVFASVPATAKEVGEAIGSIHARTGQVGEGLQKLSKQILEVSEITHTDLSANIAAATRLFGDWSISAEKQSGALDLVYRTSQQTGIGVTRLMELVVQFGAPLRSLGFSFEQSAALMGKFEKEGVNIETAMPGLRKALGTLIQAGKEPAEAFKLLQEKILSAKNETDGMRVAIEIFGKRAGPDLGRAIIEGRFNIEELTKALKEGKATIAGAAEENKTFAKSLEELSHKVTELLAPIGKELMGLAKDALAAFTELADGVSGDLKQVAASITEFIRSARDVWREFNAFLASDSEGAWESIISQVSDNLQTINKLIKVATDQLKGDVESAWRGIADIIISNLFRAGDFMTKWLQNIPAIGRGVKEILGFSRQAAEGIAGITHGLEFKADFKIPGLPAAEVQRASDEFLAAGKKVGGSFGGGAKGKMKEDLSGAFALVQDWLRQTGQVIDASLDSFKRLPKAVRDSLIQSADAFHENSISTQRWGLILSAALTDTGLQVRKVGNSFVVSSKEIETSVANIGAIIERELVDPAETWNAAMDMMAANAAAWEERTSAAARQAHDVLIQQFEDLSHQIPESFNVVIDAVLNKSGLLGEALLKVAVKVKGFVNDTLAVIGTMPGKIGDAMRGATKSIEQWISFVDNAIKLIQRIFGESQTGLAGVLGSIIGIFKQHRTQIADITQMTTQEIGKMAKAASGAGDSGGKAASSLSSLWGKASNELKIGVSAAAGAFASLTTAMAVTSATGSKTAGIMSSLFSSTLAGVQAGLAFGPVGGAIVGGISLLGGIIGAFMGKSPLQKAQEAAALQQAKDAIKKSQEEVLQMVEKTKQSWIETLDKARQLLESIQFYTRVPKVSFQAFFKDVGRLFDQLVPLAQKWKLDADASIKAAAENLAAGVALVAALPQALDAISKYLGTPDASFQAFFAATDKFFDMLGEWMESIGRKVQRKIGVFGDRVKGGVDLLGPLIEALNAMFAIKELPSEEKFALLDKAVDLIIQHVGDLAQRWDKGLLKEMEFFSQKALAALDAWLKTIEAIKAMVDLPTVTEADADRVASNLRLFLERMIASLKDMVTEDLTRLAAISETILPIAAAIKAWAEAAGAIKNYTAVAAETWDLIREDFLRGLTLIRLMVLDAADYVTEAEKFKALIDKGSATIAEALSTYTKSVRDMSSALQSGLPQGGSPLGGAAFPGAGSFSAQSAGLGAGGGGGASAPIYFAPGSVVVQGSLIHQGSLEDGVVSALVSASRKGRLSGLWATTA